MEDKLDKLYNYFKNLDSNDKIVQSFLIGNVLYNDIKEELNRVINDFILKKEVKIDENPEDFEKFEATFPYKEKKVLPGQLF